MNDVEVSRGDLWSLAWDEDALGYVLVASVFEGYVLGWPVTRTCDASFAPGVLLDSSPLGEPVTVWPARETGIGMHLLAERLGPLLEPDSVRDIAWASDDGEQLPLPTATNTADAGQNEAMVERWSQMCIHEWPTSELRYLNEDALRTAGVAASEVRETLGADNADMRDIWQGAVSISDDQVAAIAERFDLMPDDFTTSGHADDLATVLVHPRFKQAVQVGMRRTGFTESDLRDRLRREYSLAARDDGHVSVETKAMDALKRLINQAPHD